MSDAEQRATAAAREICNGNIWCAENETEAAAIILKHQPAWVSVQERLPELGMQVLCACKDGTVRQECRFGYGGWFDRAVTHWQALPAAPRPAAPAKGERMSQQIGFCYDPRLRLKQPIIASIEKDGEDYLVTWARGDVDTWGIGPTQNEAIHDFAKACESDFYFLPSHRNHLSPHLALSLAVLEEHYERIACPPEPPTSERNRT